MKLSDDVLRVLARCATNGNKLYLPIGQLDRKLYVAVNKVLAALGGKWNRSEKAHVFENDTEGILDEVVLTGCYTDAKKEYQFFETPEKLAESLVKIADIREGETVLEPSAGRGRVLEAIRKVCRNPLVACYEMQPTLYMDLSARGYHVEGHNFLSCSKHYDVIIANPPFTKQQDTIHIHHMLDIADRKVVSVASASLMWREDNKTGLLRDRIEKLGGTITPLPDNSFKSSGTGVRTCVVDVDMRS